MSGCGIPLGGGHYCLGGLPCSDHDPLPVDAQIEAAVTEALAAARGRVLALSLQGFEGNTEQSDGWRFVRDAAADAVVAAPVVECDGDCAQVSIDGTSHGEWQPDGGCSFHGEEAFCNRTGAYAPAVPVTGQDTRHGVHIPGCNDGCVGDDHDLQQTRIVEPNDTPDDSTEAEVDHIFRTASYGSDREWFELTGMCGCGRDVEEGKDKCCIACGNTSFPDVHLAYCRRRNETNPAVGEPVHTEDGEQR